MNFLLFCNKKTVKILIFSRDNKEWLLAHDDKFQRKTYTVIQASYSTQIGHGSSKSKLMFKHSQFLKTILLPFHSKNEVF